MAKRLIDAEKLKRRIIAFTTGLHANYLTIENIVMMINQADTVPAVEVCYCKDCRYARPLNDTEKLMYLDECKVCYNGDATFDGYNIVMPEHYCSYGERKGGQAPQREDV